MSKKAINPIKPDEIVFGYVIDLDDRNQYILVKYYVNKYHEYMDEVVATLIPSPEISDEDLIQELLSLAKIFANKDKVYIESFILQQITATITDSSIN